VPISVKYDPSRLPALRRVKAAVREDRDIDPADFRIAKDFVDRQMSPYHSIPITLMCLAASVYMAVHIGWHGVGYADWVRIMWTAGAVLVLPYSVASIVGRVRTARWIARHELTEII
jgi:hypothetical protein